MLEPIRQVAGDGKREKVAAIALAEYFKGWKLYATPRFFFTDFHITLMHGNGRENYIGDLEIKWLKTDSTKPAIFPFNKHSKDGYYKPKFLLIEHYPDSLKLNGKGYISFEPFLFLQEDYTREFVHSYVLSLFQEIDEQILCDTPEYIIRKAGKNKLVDQSTNYHSI